ncbi:MAG: hypothetical protein AAF098_17190 [Pseudomonadota bacterium]
MYDSTVALCWQAMVTFQQMIVLADKEGIVDMTPESLARRTNIPIEIIHKGIEHLEAPDEHSRNPESAGRRLVRLDDHRPWGWRIVSYCNYRDMASKADQRDQARLRKRRQREREREQKELRKNDASQRVTASLDESQLSRHADADADEENYAKADTARLSREVPADPGNRELRTKVRGVGDDGRAVLLVGDEASRFLSFWDAFNLKKGKQKAAGAWYQLERNGLIDEQAMISIIAAADAEAHSRPKQERGNGRPKWASGWLLEQRWRDEERQVLTGSDSDIADADLVGSGVRGQKPHEQEAELRELRAAAHTYGIGDRRVWTDSDTGKQRVESIECFRKRVNQGNLEYLQSLKR